MFLHRQLLDWEWFDNSNMVHVWIYLLLKANYQDDNWHGMKIPKGSFVTSVSSISKATGLSVQNVRTCLSKLKLTGEITIQVTNQNSIITICKYDNYNIQDAFVNNQINKPANNQLTTSNNIIKENKEKDTNVSKKKVTDYPDEFDSDWFLYGRKGSKKDSYTAWKELSEDDKRKMRIHIPHYLQSNERQYLKDFERYIKHRVFESPVYRQSNLLFDPQTIENNQAGLYDPSGWLNFDENLNAWRYFGREPKYDLHDGYTDDNRPNGARVVTQRTVYTWSSSTKSWSVTQ